MCVYVYVCACICVHVSVGVCMCVCFNAPELQQVAVPCKKQRMIAVNKRYSLEELHISHRREQRTGRTMVWSSVRRCLPMVDHIYDHI